MVTRFDTQCGTSSVSTLHGLEDLRLCIKQSYKDTVCLGLERDGFTYGEARVLEVYFWLAVITSAKEQLNNAGKATILVCTYLAHFCTLHCTIVHNDIARTKHDLFFALLNHDAMHGHL